MAIYTIKGNKIIKSKLQKFKNEKELQTLFENNLEEIFGITFLASEFVTTHGGRIDTLGIDENYSPVIIEYKENEKDNVINQGLFYLDWLVDHKGDFEMLATKKLGKNVNVNWDEPRLILVAQSYNNYDKYAVNRISGNIELWKYHLYEGNILQVESVNLPNEGKKENHKKQPKRGFNEYPLEDLLSGKPQQIKELFNKLREEILKMDEQIQEKIRKDYITYTLNKNFVTIHIQTNGLLIHLHIPKKELNDPKNITTMHPSKRLAARITAFKIVNINDTPYAMTLIKQSYENKL